MSKVGRPTGGRARLPVSNLARARTWGLSTQSRPAWSKWRTRYCAGRPRLTSSWEYRPSRARWTIVGENVWAGVRAHLDTITERAAAPVIAKYTGVLAAADIEVFTRTTTFAIMQSTRLDSGPSGPVHP